MGCFPLAELLQFMFFLDKEVMTEADLQAMAKHRLAFQELLLSKLSRPNQNWNLRKMFGLKKFEIWALYVASAAYLTTAYLEAAHKELKESAKHTNNHPNSRSVQASAHAQKRASAKRVVKALEETARERHSMVRSGAAACVRPHRPACELTLLTFLVLQQERAQVTGQVAFPASRGVRVNVNELAKGAAAEDTAAKELLMKLPYLQHLKYSLDAMAEGWKNERMGPEYGTPDPVVTVYRTAGVPRYHRAGGPMEGVKVYTMLERPVNCTSLAVYARGEAAAGCGAEAVEAQGGGAGVQVGGGDPGIPEWYCDPLVFVEVKVAGFAVPTVALAFVLYYKEDTAADPGIRELLHMTPLMVERQSRAYEKGRSRPEDRTELVYVSDILRPVCIQPNPLVNEETTTIRRGILNPYVR